MRFLVLLALAACTGPEADSDTTDTGMGTDLGTDADTDTDSDSDSDTDGFPQATQPCLWAHGIHSANTTWEYYWLAGNRTGSKEVTVFEYDAAAQTATLKTTDIWLQSPGNVNHNGTRYDYVVCNDDGLHVTQVLVDSITTIPGIPASGAHSESNYDPPALLRPNNLVLDDTWTTHYVGTYTSDGSPDQSVDRFVTHTVTQDMVHYPSVAIAGTSGGGVMTLKIEGGGGGDVWWSLGFGVIRNSSLSQLGSFNSGLQ